MDDQLQGKFEEVKGKVTNDKGEELKGDARQTVGNVKDKFEDAGDRTESEV